MMLDSDELLLFPPNLVAVVLLLVVVSHFLLREEHANNFRRLSLRFHPERLALTDGDDGERSREAAFAVIAEAFDVLSDPLKRAVYEQYGEEGLKRGVRGPGDTCIEPYVYHGQPLRTYKEFFGTESPYADLLDGVTGPLALEDCPGARGIRKKDEPVIKALPLTLNEVFHGGIKKMKIQRLVLHEGGGAGRDKEEGTTRPEEKILSIPIMPGMPPGARIVFPEEGDQGPTKIPADIIFVTEDKPHETFERDAENPSTLRMTVKIFLSDALTGTIVTVHTLDDRILRVPITSVISPDYVKRIPGEGLPLVDDPDRRGELIIDFNIEFPAHLTPASKGYVRKAFDTEGEDEGSDEEETEDERLRRVLVGRRMYMRRDKLSQICGP